MRVYYKIGDSEINSEEFPKPLNDLAEMVHYHMMVATKYKIMWALRSLEEEINNSLGVIIIESGNLSQAVKISAKDFDDELAQKIQSIAVKTKL